MKHAFGPKLPGSGAPSAPKILDPWSICRNFVVVEDDIFTTVITMETMWIDVAVSCRC